MKTHHVFPILILLLLPWLARAATYTVSNTNDTGAGSLRQAITDANGNAGADTIAFNITNLAFTISPVSALPSLTESVTIDGSTQPGYSNAPVVELSGANAGANANGFKIAAGNCVIRALAVNRFKNDGIQITNGVGSRVEGCYLGVAPDGFTRRGNGAAGVRIAGVNFGVQTTGTNVIGGEAAAAHNLISANLYGIWLSETTDNLIAGNIIGADATGSFDVGNTNMGIFCYYQAGLNVIGGTNAGARNLISGNGEEPTLYAGDGIRLDSSSSNSIFGNFIGVNVDGTYAIPNGEHGVNIQYGLFNLVGGAAAGQSNLISGNLVHGVNLGGSGGGESIFNYAGTPPPLPDGNVIQGNLIGVTLTGALPLGNGYDGVYLNANFNTVGGTNAGAGNVIAYNGNNGVEVGYHPGNLVLGNSIYANTNLGIDLGGDYVTYNDAGDGDTGANNFQNYPVLSRAVTNAAQTIITASLNSANNLTYRVELFDNPTNDPSGYGEGQTYLGFTDVTTDGGGNVSFTFTNPAALPLGHYLTATATAPDGNTSEFSFARKVVSANTLDLAVTLAESADPVPHFTNFTYTITATNYGPTNATAVFVTNRLSSGLTFVSAAASQGSAPQSAGVVTWNVGALADGVGASLVITVHGNVTALESNSVVAVAAQVENDTSNNSAVETTSIGIADLGMSLADSPDPVVAGHPLTYTLTVTNLGPDAASGSVANFYLDGSQVFNGASISQGTFAQYGNFIQATFNTINAHAIATLTVTAIPTAVGTNFSNGNLSRLEYDPDTVNDSDFEETVVQAGPGILEFTMENYFVNEGGGSALIGVQRLGGAVGTVGATFATSNLTATAGSDYTATNGVLVFTNGETLKSFRVFITDDMAAECNETLRLRLYSPTGGVILLAPTNATLEIFDNEISSVGTIKAVSLAQTNLLTTGNQGSYGLSISDDARYVAFHSYANNLVPTMDQNNSADVFIHDRVTHSNTLVSLNAQGAASSGGSYQAQISADGSRVGFLGDGSDLTTNVATLQQIYVRTLASGVNQLVSVSTNGAGGNNYSYTFSLSTNGAKVAYHSLANNLVAGVADTNTSSDVFFRDLTTGTNQLVSINSAGTASGNSYSDRPVISADGRYVVFGSYASNLSPSDSNTRYDIYRRDVVNGTNALVSANTGGTAGNGTCEYPYAVSADGRYVTFQSSSTDLAAGTPSFTRQTFQRDMTAGTTVIVSKNNSGVAANGYTYLYGASRDGRYVLFDTYASNVTTNDNNFTSDVFVRDVLSNTTYTVSVNRTNTGPGDNYSVGSAISPDGRYVTFISRATDLVAASSPAFTYELYQRDLVSATTTLLTTRLGDTNGANDGINDSAVSSNGVAVFSSYATDLAPLDANGGSLDAFARAPGDTNATLLSFALGVTGSSYSSQNVMNGAGTKVAFASYAANLVAGDTNFDQDIFLGDLAASTTTLVSVNAAGTGSAMGYSENPSLSEDGRYVVYQSGAQNIVANDANGFTDVYLRDTVAGTNALVSLNQGGTGGRQRSLGQWPDHARRTLHRL